MLGSIIYDARRVVLVIYHQLNRNIVHKIDWIQFKDSIVIWLWKGLWYKLIAYIVHFIVAPGIVERLANTFCIFDDYIDRPFHVTIQKFRYMRYFVVLCSPIYIYIRLYCNSTSAIHISKHFHNLIWTQMTINVLKSPF